MARLKSIELTSTHRHEDNTRHGNGKVVRVTALVFTVNVEACLEA